jgi:threonine aldolase
MIDLRSDTVTRPTSAMRQAMARAEVGDDVYGEDPSVRALEEEVAAMLGKEAALFVPSGTMGNQLALLTSTRRGDEVICGEGAHLSWFESGAAAALSGVQFAVAGQGGLFDVGQMEAAVKPRAFYHPRTSLVAIENTHNRAGGRIFPQADILAIAKRARALELRLHLDGARLWNVSAANGSLLSDLAAPFDTVSICFSKGLGAPVGSALCAGRAQIEEAHRLRKMLGAGMRQSGILAAGALHAIHHHRSRLPDDHAHAKLLASELRSSVTAAGVTIEDPETNIVNVDLPQGIAQRVAELAKEKGVLIGSILPARLRAVLHLDVSRDEAIAGARALGLAIRAAWDER